MVDIHMYPAKIDDAAGRLRSRVLTQWQAQLDSYTAARQAMQDGIARGYAAGGNSWLGGPGKSGDLQASSKSLLQSYVKELDRLIQEKTDFLKSFTAYVNHLSGVANGVRSADSNASATFDNILKPGGAGS